MRDGKLFKMVLMGEIGDRGNEKGKGGEDKYINKGV